MAGINGGGLLNGTTEAEFAILPGEIPPGLSFGGKLTFITKHGTLDVDPLSTILEAATRAPNGGNRQRWRFLVVRDHRIKQQLGEWYKDAHQLNIAGYDSDEAVPRVYRESFQSMVTQHMEDIPVLILVCQLRSGGSSTAPTNIIVGGGAASIYPAVQNLMLAARALGLGTVLTTQHIGHEEEVKSLLGIPDDVNTAALIPLGYPAEGEHFGGSKRRPISEVAFSDQWGSHWPSE